MTQRRITAAAASGLGTLAALFAVFFGAAVPGSAGSAPALPPTAAAVPAGISASPSGEPAGSRADGGHADWSATEATPPHLFRDTAPERHAAHPGGAAAHSGVDLPRPRVTPARLPDAPVADGDRLRSARQLGRAPPVSPGN